MSLRHVLILCTLLIGRAAYSQQLPPATASLNKVIAATVERKAAQMGYTSLSQVVQATEDAMGKMAARAAATEGAAASWLAIPAALAAVAAATMVFPTALSDQAVDQWQYNKDGTISITGNPKVSGGTITPQFPALNNGTPLWGGSVGGPIGYGGSANAAAQAAAQAWTTQSQSGTKYTMAVKSCTSVSSTSANCTYIEKDASGNLIGNPTGGVQQSGTFSHGSCASGLYYNNACQSYVPPRVRLLLCNRRLFRRLTRSRRFRRRIYHCRSRLISLRISATCCGNQRRKSRGITAFRIRSITRLRRAMQALSSRRLLRRGRL